MNFGVGIALREVVDGTESVTIFVERKVSALFKGIENFLSIHYLSDFYYKDNDFFRQFQIILINNLYILKK